MASVMDAYNLLKAFFGWEARKEAESMADHHKPAEAARTENRRAFLINLLYIAVLAALFLLARSYGEGRSSGRALTALSGLSFGVYLVHPMAIQFWQKAWHL